MKVTIRRAKVVRPADETPKGLLWNSAVDLVIPRIHTPSVYLYKKVDADNFFAWEVMEAALARALVAFYPMGGRLAEGGSGRIYIDCNAAGALLVEAEVDGSLEEQLAPTTLSLHQLVPEVAYTHDIGAYPLLLLQATFFKRCGGVALGVGMHHHVADGMSGLHFINAWADIARGLGVKTPPFIDRRLLRARDPPAPAHAHLEYQPPPRLLADGADEEEGGGGSRPATFHLTKQQIEALRRDCIDPLTHVTYTTYEAVSAHIWKCVSAARRLCDAQDTKLYIATDGRPRLRPPLPEGYFGNVIFTAAAIVKAGDLIHKPLHYAAHVIRKALARMDDEYLRSALDYLELQPDLRKLVRGAHTFKSPNLGITSWVRLPIHDADFGWGRPVFMGPAGIPYEGLAFMLPSPKGDGGITVSLALATNHMAFFEQTFYDFLRTN